MAVKKEFYLTLREASAAAQALGISSSLEFHARYKQNPRLPSNPNQCYKNEWLDWPSFLGKDKPQPKYQKLREASAAAQALGISSSLEFHARYKQDPHLPACPELRYKNEWLDWPSFLGKDKPQPKYQKLREASAAAQALGITSQSQYQALYKQDPRLPAKPDRCYKNEWQDWRSFLGKSKPEPKYQKLREASAAARALGITSQSEYRSSYKQDPRLPANPDQYYKNEWQDSISFFLPQHCTCLADLKYAVKVLGIKNSREYRRAYSKYPSMPSHPERSYSPEWVDWNDLCDTPSPYSYEEARRLVINAGVKSQADYRKLALSTNDPRLPSTPDKIYKKEWKNWHQFTGKEEPFSTNYIPVAYRAWGDAIDTFMKTARGGSTKSISLCRFVRLYIQDNELDNSPIEFLTREHIDIQPFRALLSQQTSDKNRQKLLNAVNEFIEYIIRENFTLEDGDTGELVTATIVTNPFAQLTVVIQQDNSGQLGETCKPALAYQYVEAMRKWLVPSNAKAFKDLTHIQQFDADWIDIPSSKIDNTDPDCVWKTVNGKTKLWFPVYWMHTYALISMPGRGRQIAYNDSGEGDVVIPEFIDSKLVWVSNRGSLAGTTINQGFISRSEDDAPGMRFTSNKTSKNGEGYSVPWMPDDLAYWLVKLRNWQQKYNPLTKPTAWIDLKRTALNESQRKAKGHNCFLFRDFGEVECGYFGGRLTDRLAAALFYSQPSDLQLATLEENPNALSHYKSRYTPHSMRVSLITAYVMEFGLPIEVIMKVAGHSSMLMSLYYTKLNSQDFRHRFGEGEKRALRNKAYAAQRMIEQQRIDEIKHELVSNSERALSSISNSTPAGNFLFRDYGICPYAGARCEDGGPQSGKHEIWHPAPAGYLGSQNCLRCRHFITGPAFIGGLLYLSNEISLQAHHQFEHYDELEANSAQLKSQITELENTAYDAEVSGKHFDEGPLNQLRLERRKIRSEAESAAMKLDVLLCDTQAVAKLIKQSQALINQQPDDKEQEVSAQLIVQPDHELHLALEESSYFQQLSEVCENAEIYESASAEMAIAPRSQLLDKMALLNNLDLHLFTLDKKQQLIVGNQLTQLLLSRLKTWERVDAVIDGRISIQDLEQHERITISDINTIKPHTLEVLPGGKK